MGGIGTLPMDYGQSLQVPQQQQQPSFSSAQNITMNPLLNYGQPQLGTAGGTPLTMASGGMSRLGYQEGGMGMEMMQPQMQDPMMQEQMMQPPMQDQMQGQMMQGEGGEEQGQTALLTIIQLLIEQGIDPETAKELAAQILEAFAQGGAPAVEEFSNQLEQEEGMQQEPMMMAEGGLTSIDRARDMLQRRAPSGEFLAYINPQEAGILRSMGGAGQDVNVRGVPSFFIKKAFKSVAKAVKSIAKSPIGMIALSIAAPYAIGAFAPGFATFGNAALGQIGGAALRAGISNLAVQGITTGKFNPKQALLAAAAGGALAGFQGADAMAARDAMNAGDYMQYGSSVQNVTPTLSSGVVPSVQTGAEFASATPYDVSRIPQQTGAEFASATPYDSIPGKVPVTGTNLNTYNFSPAAQSVMNPTIGDRFTQGIDYLKSTGTNLMADPVGTIGRGLGSIYDTASQTIKDNPLLSVGGAFLAGQQFRAPLPGEDPNEYNKLKAAHDAEVAGYVTQYGGGAKVYSPGEFGLYAREKAIDPFAGRSSYAADGGYITNRQNYFLGKRVSAVATPQSGGSTEGGSGMGGMMAKLIQQNPQMFRPQSTTVRQPRTGEFIDINQNGIDDRDEGMMYGGRAGYSEGSISFERKTLERKGYGDMMKNMTPREISQLYDSVMGTFSRRFQAEGSMPMGEPRRNPAGIMELDYRAKGGFVPPIGIKEKADDIPAMLSNNEFVFTADAVRAAGGGSVNKGAQRMYGLMKQLESRIA
jgi:hypothetical protein